MAETRLQSTQGLHCSSSDTRPQRFDLPIFKGEDDHGSTSEKRTSEVGTPLWAELLSHKYNGSSQVPLSPGDALKSCSDDLCKSSEEPEYDENLKKDSNT
jgi:hypothetical protein